VTEFDPACTACPRLSAHLRSVRDQFPDYHGRPVPAFGDRRCALLIVGLAPGLHGANASGRPFTGDYAGILLYRMLHRHGLASAPESVSADDGLRLHRCRITNAVKCLPPENKPLTEEVVRCNGYLRAELAALARGTVVLALGRVAHGAVLRAFGLTQAHYPFAHGAEHRLPEGPLLIDSYHCSRYNTQTGRLTEAMFGAVMARASKLALGAA